MSWEIFTLSDVGGSSTKCTLIIISDKQSDKYFYKVPNLAQQSNVVPQKIFIWCHISITAH
jgi:hypothetical protein